MYRQSAHSVFIRRNKNNYVKNIFQILNIYFWIHGVGISKRKGIFTKCMAVGLTAFYVVNSFAFFIIQCNLLGVTDSNVKNLGVLFLVFSLGLSQRWLLLSRKEKLYNIVKKLQKILSRNFKLFKKGIKLKIFFLLIFIDAYVLLLYVSVIRSLRSAALFQESNSTLNNTDKFGLSNVIHLNLFFIHWSDIGMLIAIYFIAICHILKVIFTKLEKEANKNNMKRDRLVFVYNESVDACKEANDIFSAIVLLVFVNFLSSVFYHSFNIFFNDADISRYLTMIFGYLVFAIMCYVASTVSASAFNAKYAIEKSEMFNGKKSFTEAINTSFVGLKILDSVIIDKSFILSATGVLVTYGVMIATFNVTSQKE